DLQDGGGVIVVGRLRVGPPARQSEVGEEVRELQARAVGERGRAVAVDGQLLRCAPRLGRDDEAYLARLTLGREARLEEAVAPVVVRTVHLYERFGVAALGVDDAYARQPVERV